MSLSVFVDARSGGTDKPQKERVLHYLSAKLAIVVGRLPIYPKWRADRYPLHMPVERILISIFGSLRNLLR